MVIGRSAWAGVTDAANAQIATSTILMVPDCSESVLMTRSARAELEAVWLIAATVFTGDQEFRRIYFSFFKKCLLVSWSPVKTGNARTKPGVTPREGRPVGHGHRAPRRNVAGHEGDGGEEDRDGDETERIAGTYLHQHAADDRGHEERADDADHDANERQAD